MSHTMKTTAKFSLLAACAALAILLGVGMGSVFIPTSQVGSILIHRMFGLPMPEAIDPVYPAMIFNMRLPRVLLAFLTGAALSVSGTVMQSVLRNPLASPFGLGVSAGAGLGAAIIIAAGISSGLLGAFLMPAVSLSFAMITVVLVVGFATRMDRMLSNTTIVLIGMVVSLFLNAIISMLSTLSPSNAQRISLWTLGSFSMKEWDQVFALAPVTLLCIAFFLRFSALVFLRIRAFAFRRLFRRGARSLFGFCTLGISEQFHTLVSSFSNASARRVSSCMAAPFPASSRWRTLMERASTSARSISVSARARTFSTPGKARPGSI